MGFPLSFYDMSMRLLWDASGNSYGIVMGFLCGSYAISMLCL
jgi:hypothetical protein